MMSKNDQSIEALRQILLQDDLTKLQKLEDDLFDLRQTIADKESLIASLDPIIAELLDRKIAGSKDEMAETLAPIMGEAIKRQVAEAKDDVIDALYPVIGKVIRKSVAESMKKFVDSVNQRIEEALRSRLFKKRVQSKLTGIPERELILKDALPFKIEQIFLIHKESGLLISHVSSEASDVKIDEELISGMLTAIRDFVAEAFQNEKDQDLDAIQYGGNQILLEMGHYSYLAIVVSGFQPAIFQDDVRKLGRRIHNRFFQFLRNFNGEMTRSGEITTCLKRFYEKYNSRLLQKAPIKSKPYLIYVLIFFVLLAIAVFAVRKIPVYLSGRKLQHSIESKIASIPELRSEDIKCRISNGWLTVSGFVPSVRHISLVDSVAREIPEIKGFHNRLIVGDEPALAAEVIRQIRHKMSGSTALRDLAPRFIIEHDQIIIEGSAPDLQAKREIGFIASEIPGIRFIVNNLEIHGEKQFSLEEIRTMVQQHIVSFQVNDATIAESETEKLDAVLKCVQNLSDIKLIVKGYSDNSSTPDYNLNLSRQRAQVAADYFMRRNYPSHQIIVEYFGAANPLASNDTEQGRAKNRRVEFDVLKER